MSINSKARVNAISEQLAKPRNPADLGSFEGVPNIPTIATDTIGAYVPQAYVVFTYKLLTASK
jgi:hypothetical protein